MTVALAVICSMIGAAAAEAAGRPSQPVCRTTAHFEIHCDASGALVDVAATSFEEAYGHDVAGGGLSPNAGLRAPVDDGDGKTDVYLMAPPDKPGFSGGIVYRDPSHEDSEGIGQAAYVFMTTDLSSSAFRFRAAHEFMHILATAYYGYYGISLEEGLANWAAEFALADVDPLDNNFASPQLPFDCSYGTWPETPGGKPCGNGYWQWLFFQRQVEDFGADFIASLMERARADYPTDIGFPALREELAARTGTAEDIALRSRYASYAKQVWDPWQWQTAAVGKIFDEFGPPLYTNEPLNPDPDTDVINVHLDHLSAYYVRVPLIPGVENPGDAIRISVWQPAEVLTPPQALIGLDEGDKSRRQAVGMTATGAGGYTVTIPYTAARANRTIVVPLINDTEATDNLEFGYRIQRLTAPDTTAPVITELALSNTRFRVSPKPTAVNAAHRPRVPKGTEFRLRLSERSTVEIVIERLRGDRRVVGTLTRRNQGPGGRRIAFSGRIGKRALKQGRYRATIAATDPAGNRSAEQHVGFVIVER